MSCWRVLELSDQENIEQIPQLLIKPCFGAEAYTIFLTDLSNIWSEELDLPGIVHRASEEESPIEVGKQDTSQLAILLDNVGKSLAHHDDTICDITRSESDGVILHTVISLPEPLDSLSWRFYFRKRTAATLKNELILPLLVSSHIQHERINSLISNISEKDRAITRLIDQYESSNLDLAAAFPSIGGFKSGRRLVKREQAAKHIPGLQIFSEDLWKRETAELEDTSVSTLGMFREALTDCTPKVPPQLRSEDGSSNTWWKTIGAKDDNFKPALRTKSQSQREKAGPPPKAAITESDADEDETEDEFETHENFKLREIGRPPAGALGQTLTAAGPTGPSKDESSTDEESDNDDDLDAPPKSQSQSRTHRKITPLEKALTVERSPPKPKSPTASPPPKAQVVAAQKSKGKGFRIGGKAKKTESPPPSSAEIDLLPSEDIPMRARSSTDMATADEKLAKKGFRIGGKAKVTTENRTSEPSAAIPRNSGVNSAPKETSSAASSRSAPAKIHRESTPIEEEHEETAEEKAERKRRELKRKNEEQAKKQAQSKKKKRF